MSTTVLSLSRTKIKHSWKTAFFSAAILGMLVHMYKFTNGLPYFDSLYNYYSSQNMLGHGRWFLSAACALTSYFDLPWFIGVAAVFYLSLTAVVVTDVLEIENPCLIAICSGLLVSFPAVTETMFFQYLSDGFFLAMLLSALAVRFSTLEYVGSRRHFLLSSCLLCLSCGIYQSYVAFALVLAICYFLGKLLEGEVSLRQCVNWIVFQAGVYAVALAGYFGIWKLLQAVSGVEALDYQGISQIGQVSPAGLIQAGIKSLISLAQFLVDQNPFKYGLSLYSGLNLLSCLAFGGVLCVAAVKGGLFRRKGHMALAALCVAVLPFVCYFCFFASPGVTYYTRMLQCVVFLYIFTGVLCERWITGKGKNLVLVLLLAVLWNQAIMANVCYVHLDRTYEQSYAFAQELATRIHLEDDGTARYIALIGSPDTVSEEDYQDDSQLGTLGPLKLVYKAELFYPDHIFLFLDQYTGFTLTYYRETGEAMPLQELEPGAPVPVGTEIRLPTAGWYQESYVPTGEVETMGIWPGKDSVRQIGDTIVVKLSEP